MAGCILTACTVPAASPPDQVGSPAGVLVSPAASASDPAAISAAPSPSPSVTASAVGTTPMINPNDKKPDGKGVLNFTVVLHLEGWNDGENRNIFKDHADKLRAYAELFEKYGAKMTLESKEIIDGCIRWNDNVLLELQQKGHAVGIHADAGGEDGATVDSISRTLTDMKDKLAQLGIDAAFASGVASKADWVLACENAGIGVVTCMVNYGLWSLDPALRPDFFEPWKTPAQGHGPFPEDMRDRLHAWYAESGSNWIVPKPEGNILIIPPGLSLNNAYEELHENASTTKSDFTADDIEAWTDALPQVLAATDSHKVNAFYAVWSFGQALDEALLEDWLKVIDGYAKQGRIEWKNMNDIIALYTD
jgi:hypothetical protein